MLLICVGYRREDPPLFASTIQFPLHPEVDAHAPLCIFTLQEIRICIDPLLCKWLLYKPKYYVKLDTSSGFNLVYFSSFIL